MSENDKSGAKRGAEAESCFTVIRIFKEFTIQILALSNIGLPTRVVQEWLLFLFLSLLLSLEAAACCLLILF